MIVHRCYWYYKYSFFKKKIVIHEIQYSVKKKEERKRFITICFIRTYSTSRDTNPFLKQRIPFMRSLWLRGSFRAHSINRTPLVNRLKSFPPARLTMFLFPPLSTMSRPIKNRPCSIQSPVYRDIELTVIVNYESVADHRRHNSYDKLRYIFGKSYCNHCVFSFRSLHLCLNYKTPEIRQN